MDVDLKMKSPWIANIDSISRMIDTGKEDRKIGIKGEIDMLEGLAPNKFEFRLMPEPYIGNPDAGIYLLNLNPAVDRLVELQDAMEIGRLKRRFEDHVLCNYALYDEVQGHPCSEFREFPFYHLDPNYKCFQGFWWWYRKLNKIIDAVADRLRDNNKGENPGNQTRKAFSRVAKSVFDIEILAYHSKSYSSVRNNVSSSLPGLESVQYSIGLVKNAMKEGKTIIIMQGSKDWENLVPELKNGENVYKLRSKRNATISADNIESASNESGQVFDELIRQIVSEN